MHGLRMTFLLTLGMALGARVMPCLLGGRYVRGTCTLTPKLRHG
jgi:hypothetical protein